MIAGRALSTIPAFFALALGACSAMRPVKTPSEYIESVHPKRVRITRTDGTRFVMTGARIMRGMVMGFVKQPRHAVAEFQAVPLDLVSRVDAQQWAPYRTAGLVVGLGALVTVGGQYMYRSSKSANGASTLPGCVDDDQC